MDAIEATKNIIQWLVIPLVGVLGWFLKKHQSKVETIENRLSNTEIRISVLESKIDDMREDIKEIKRGVEKLCEKK